MSFQVGDGYYGWSEMAPFDAIMVTAAVEHIPQPLIDQLAPGGRLVLPVGERPYSQDLLLVKKDQYGAVKITRLLPVSFVPLSGSR
ncbi:MAG: hypothetical protein ABW141_06220 [Candidatus Thiodiazotropha endolucinida]